MYKGFHYNRGFMISHPQTFEVIQWGCAVDVPSANSYALRQAYKRAYSWLREFHLFGRPPYYLIIYRVCDDKKIPAYIVDWQGNLSALEVK